MPPNENHRPEDVTAQGLDLAASLIRELFVDFLGSLFPGFLFTMFAVPMVLWTGAVLLGRGLPDWSGIAPPFQVPNSVLFSLLIVVSYVVGFVFSRRDPKVPDQKSLAYILRKDWRDIERAVVRPRPRRSEHELDPETMGKAARLFRRLNPGNWAIMRRWVEIAAEWFPSLKIKMESKKLARGEGGQFPYSHLREYLEARGLHHLAQHVPWRGSGNIDRRSKLFINLLKIRLQCWNPRKCGDIVRNEAHVRMMSSSWYAARLLQEIYMLLLLALLLAAFDWVPFHFQAQFPWAIVVVLCALLIAATVLRRSVVMFLHYQRVREIVFVLATAHASWNEGNKEVFEGFEPAQPESS